MYLNIKIDKYDLMKLQDGITVKIPTFYASNSVLNLTEIRLELEEHPKKQSCPKEV